MKKGPPMPEEQKIIRFVIIDDHPMTRRGF
jgi:hypothetical protein